MVTGGAEHASKPVIPCRVKEEFRAVALARAGCLLTGALMVRLIRASPATVPETVPRRAGWPGDQLATPGAGPTGNAQGNITATDHIEAAGSALPVHGRNPVQSISCQRRGRTELVNRATLNNSHDFDEYLRGPVAGPGSRRPLLWLRSEIKEWAKRTRRAEHCWFRAITTTIYVVYEGRGHKGSIQRLSARPLSRLRYQRTSVPDGKSSTQPTSS
jgi:hypothetical protein